MEVSANVILALDIGLRRIGVAKAVENIPLCLNPILRKNRKEAAEKVKRLIIESSAKTLVVGFPAPNEYRDFKGDLALENEAILTMQKRILHFINLLELPSSVEVVLLDESFSTKEALDRLENKEMRKKANKKDGSLDSITALVILERYLTSIKIS